ncbi:purple acid phosphatase-like protein [Lacibacter cauensis]|uniref:Purple acid phosphatase-like protein n=1 Tax=Lacibacter cauensis TaxID=510947 RepID=A0A562SVH2_9BACT|nr:FN3 domain-containing metallophosphoesterase family protein [Lacibacter cauensis]TWI85024.1 purple acid phosphatase-like protein [Lacibacter cauensis]
MENQKPSFNRRKFLTNAAKIAGVGAAGFIYIKGCDNEPSEVEPGPGSKHVFLTDPYLLTLESSKLYIRWITNLKSYSWVEFGETENFTHRQHTVNNGLVQANTRIHEVELDNLKPGTNYYYRVASKSIVKFQPYKVVYGETIYSKTFQFITMDEQATEASWLILNDIHDVKESYSHLISLNKNESFDYVFLNGDMFNDPESEEQVIELTIKPCAETFAAQKPMIFVRGNHDIRGQFARETIDYLSFPNGAYFTYRHGPVFVIVLDTGEDKEDTAAVYSGLVDFENFRRTQAAWLEKVLQSEAYKNAPFKVVKMHIPTHYTVGAKGELHCRKLFTPLLNQYKVDLVISGHTHKYGVYPPNAAHHYPLVIGGGPKPGTRTLIKVKANMEELKLQMLDDSGKQVGEYIVKR